MFVGKYSSVLPQTMTSTRWIPLDHLLTTVVFIYYQLPSVNKRSSFPSAAIGELCEHLLLPSLPILWQATSLRSLRSLRSRSIPCQHRLPGSVAKMQAKTIHSLTAKCAEVAKGPGSGFCMPLCLKFRVHQVADTFIPLRLRSSISNRCKSV